MDYVKKFYGTDWEQMKNKTKHYKDVDRYWDKEKLWLEGKSPMSDKGKEVILGDTWQPYD